MDKKMSADGEYVFILYSLLTSFLDHYEILDNSLLNYVKLTVEFLKDDNYRLNKS